MLYPKKLLCALSLLSLSAFAFAEGELITPARGMDKLFTDPSAAVAQKFTGQMGVQLTIVSNCTINGGASGSANFGTLDFGDFTTLKQVVEAKTDIIGAGVSMTCSNGLNYTVDLDSGANLASGTRNLASGATKIPYTLMNAKGEPWGKENNKDGLGDGQSFTGDGTAITLSVFGKVGGKDIAYPAGVYKDTVGVTISW
jgi:spore coat protein U-like protein